MPIHRNKVKTLFLTYPRCSVSRERILEHFQSLDTVLEYCICNELHQDGTDHRHAYIKFSNGFPTSEFTPLFDVDGHHGNYQAVRSAKRVLAYVSKDTHYITNLSDAYLETPAAKRAKFVSTLVETSVSTLAATGVISYQSMRAAVYAKSVLLGPYQHWTVRGIWYYGPPHMGKSHRARQFMGDVYYEKQQNKWWDHYDGQQYVFLDDFDTDFQESGHLFKRWSDKWAVTGEIKGGTVQLRHTHFIVTSNYPISHFWNEGTLMGQAIRRRFAEIYVPRLFRQDQLVYRDYVRCDYDERGDPFNFQ